jgi:hypothetical protein
LTDTIHNTEIPGTKFRVDDIIPNVTVFTGSGFAVRSEIVLPMAGFAVRRKL